MRNVVTSRWSLVKKIRVYQCQSVAIIQGIVFRV